MLRITFFPRPQIMPLASSPSSLRSLRQLALELLACAITELFPKAELIGGRTTEAGFYYEVAFPEEVDRALLLSLQERMYELCRRSLPVEFTEMLKSNAVCFFRDRKQQVKAEHIKSLECTSISLVKIGSFYDFCPAACLKNTGELKAFRLHHFSSEEMVSLKGKRRLVTRIQGTAFFDKKSLVSFGKKWETAKKFHHYKLLLEMGWVVEGKELFWTEKGSRIRNQLKDWLRSQLFASGWKELFSSPENSCGSHTRVFGSRARSFRDLPQKYFEFSVNQWQGEERDLFGVLRTHFFEKERSHLYCARDQLENLLISSLQFFLEICNMFGLKFRCYLMGKQPSDEREYAQLKQAAELVGLEHEVDEYANDSWGPSLVFSIFDQLGSEWRGPTLGVVTRGVSKEALVFDNARGEKEKAVIVRRSLFGSVERFLALLVEQHRGQLPFWLIPEQVRVAHVGSGTVGYAKEVLAKLQERSIRAEADWRDRGLADKLNTAFRQRVPNLLIVGDKEKQAGKVSLAVLGEEDRQVLVDLDPLIDRWCREGRPPEIATRVTGSKENF